MEKNHFRFGKVILNIKNSFKSSDFLFFVKNLIVKLGALGDVVRTTVLLGELGGDIHWLSRKNAQDLLGSEKISEKYFFEDSGDIERLKDCEFDLIINLEEERETLDILKKIKKKRLIGTYLNEKNEIDYTQESSYWFDMSLVSKFGKEKADKLKYANKKSVPEILINMLGKDFNLQEYDLGVEGKDSAGKVGLVDCFVSVWPNKQWQGYMNLYNKLKEDSYDVYFLGMRPTLKEHIDDINDCELIVCGDTLGMHIALALRKKIIALFNCTPPQEVEDYGRIKKIVSPLCNKYLYKREFSEEAVCAVKVGEVYTQIKEFLKK